MKNIAIASLWKRAAEALRQCEEITIIGYSLPPADFLAEFLLREGYGNSSAKRVTVVSPNASDLAEERFKNIFGSSIITINAPFLEWGTLVARAADCTP